MYILNIIRLKQLSSVPYVRWNACWIFIMVIRLIIYIYIAINNMCIYIYIYMCVCVCVCVYCDWVYLCVYIYIYIYIYIIYIFNKLIGLVGRVCANSPGNLGSNPGRIIWKTLKMVLGTSLRNTQQYKVCIKGKVEWSRERSSALPCTSL